MGLTGCGTKTNNKPTNKRTYPIFSKKEISKKQIVFQTIKPFQPKYN
jgi:hypothetical protein